MKSKNGVKLGNLRIPAIKGDKGDKGDKGEAGRIEEVRIKTLEVGRKPTVQNLGTETDAIIEFGIPEGESLTRAYIESTGELILEFKSGKIENVGIVKGVGISLLRINENGELLINLTDGSSFNFGKIVGTDGVDGKDGFSPTITEKVNTDTEYILEVTNEDGSFETPNLMPNIKDKIITSTVDNLINYYLKSETYSKEEVLDLLSRINKASLLKVDVLPEIGESNIIYLVPSELENICYQHIYTSNRWINIGSTDINLLEYAKEEWVEAKISDTKKFVTEAIENFDSNKVNFYYLDEGIPNKDTTEYEEFLSNFNNIINAGLKGITTIICVKQYTIQDSIYDFYFIINTKVSKELIAYNDGSSFYLESSNKVRIPSKSQSQPGYTMTYSYFLTLDISKKNDKEYILNEVILETLNGTASIDPIQKYNTTFKPTEPYHPVPKEYVDNIIGDINLILDAINGEVIGEELATLKLEDEILLENNINNENEEVIENGNE